MASANDKSPAKPIRRFQDGKITLSAWPENRISLQRMYTHDGKTGYASSFRLDDVAAVKKLLDQFVIWADEQEADAEETPSKA